MSADEDRDFIDRRRDSKSSSRAAMESKELICTANYSRKAYSTGCRIVQDAVGQAAVQISHLILIGTALSLALCY